MCDIYPLHTALCSRPSTKAPRAVARAQTATPRRRARRSCDRGDRARAACAVPQAAARRPQPPPLPTLDAYSVPAFPVRLVTFWLAWPDLPPLTLGAGRARKSRPAALASLHPITQLCHASWEVAGRSRAESPRGDSAALASAEVTGPSPLASAEAQGSLECS